MGDVLRVCPAENAFPPAARWCTGLVHWLRSSPQGCREGNGGHHPNYEPTQYTSALDASERHLAGISCCGCGRGCGCGCGCGRGDPGRGCGRGGGRGCGCGCGRGDPGRG